MLLSASSWLANLAGAACVGRSCVEMAWTLSVRVRGGPLRGRAATPEQGRVCSIAEKLCVYSKASLIAAANNSQMGCLRAQQPDRGSCNKP